MKPQDDDNGTGEPMGPDMLSPLSPLDGAQDVKAALKRASEATGAGFELLYNMARRESALDPAAKATTSSAAGLFQFIEQTWLAAVKTYGARHGLDEEAGSIAKDASGKFTVADAEKRAAILDLRFDPLKAAALAGELVEENRAGLERRLGRAVEAGEVYAAHFLGLGGAAKLLLAPPDAVAADLAPKAAEANRAVFYDGSRAKTVREIIASMAKSMGAKAAPTTPTPRVGASTLAETAMQASALEAMLAPDPEKGWTLTLSPARIASVSASASSSETSPESDPAPAAPLEKKAAPYPAWMQSYFDEAGLNPLLSPVALAALQAIDPTDLGAARDEDR